ncbi:unnamed protein product [Closterium sp. Naga37s-1]|nr:unnamed protein product [Closterium sp. Naga37s-1]
MGSRAKWDPFVDGILEIRVRNWLEAVLKEKLPPDTALADTLADGMILSRLTDILSPFAPKGAGINQRQQQQQQQQQGWGTKIKWDAMTFTDNFLTMCKAFGLSAIDLFTSTDVVEKKGTKRVCLCIRALALKLRAAGILAIDFEPASAAAAVSVAKRMPAEGGVVDRAVREFMGPNYRRGWGREDVPASQSGSENSFELTGWGGTVGAAGGSTIGGGDGGDGSGGGGGAAAAAASKAESQEAKQMENGTGRGKVSSLVSKGFSSVCNEAEPKPKSVPDVPPVSRLDPHMVWPPPSDRLAVSAEAAGSFYASLDASRDPSLDAVTTSAGTTSSLTDVSAGVTTVCHSEGDEDLESDYSSCPSSPRAAPHAPWRAIVGGAIAFVAEINHGGAGGLYAELVQNRGFEAGGQETPSTIHPWLPMGSEPHVLLSTERCSPFPRNPIALRIDIHCPAPPSPRGDSPTAQGLPFPAGGRSEGEGAQRAGEEHLGLPSQGEKRQPEPAVGWEQPALGGGAAARKMSAARALTQGETLHAPVRVVGFFSSPGGPAGVGVWAAVRQWVGGLLGVTLADGDSRGELAGRRGVGGGADGGRGRERYGEEGEEGGDGRVCEDGVGVLNPGYWGMSIVQGRAYNIILHARATARLSLRLSFLCSPALPPLPPLSSVPTVGSAHISLNQSMAATWHRYEATITATGTCHNASLAITTGSMTRGTLWLDQISAMPAETFKSHGMRADIASMLQALSPGFMRFPGGCYVEGVRLANAFRWRSTIGPWELRPGHFNDRWGYWSDDGLGFFEYLQFAEDLGATPIWVFNSGNSHTDSVFTGALAPFIQEVLDGIEFARGPSDSRWGAERTAMGHPEPFDLRHVGIGNENCYQDNYRGNFLRFRAAIKAAYPDMAVVYTCDVSKGPPDHPPTDLYDFHSFGTAEGIFSLGHYFDDISRDGPKAFLSEFAVQGGGGDGNVRAAVAEAGFLIGLERNSDVVAMVSYAPLLVNVHDRSTLPSFQCLF